MLSSSVGGVGIRGQHPPLKEFETQVRGPIPPTYFSLLLTECDRQPHTNTRGARSYVYIIRLTTDHVINRRGTSSYGFVSCVPPRSRVVFLDSLSTPRQRRQSATTKPSYSNHIL